MAAIFRNETEPVLVRTKDIDAKLHQKHQEYHEYHEYQEYQEWQEWQKWQEWQGYQEYQEHPDATAAATATVVSDAGSTGGQRPQLGREDREARFHELRAAFEARRRRAVARAHQISQLEMDIEKAGAAARQDN
ncbi:hypothetical protein BGW39_001465 [Mortierella sp. 14UC]|nr:hypothetical protein BGW39_001465 [Mortierella sp. 14UC]